MLLECFLKCMPHKICYKQVFFSISSDHLFSDEFYIEIASTSNLQNIISNGTILLTVISYKNLTNYLPRMYFQRNG